MKRQSAMFGDSDSSDDDDDTHSATTTTTPAPPSRYSVAAFTGSAFGAGLEGVSMSATTFSAEDADVAATKAEAATFDYDAAYEEEYQRRREEAEAKARDRKPKYIGALIAKSELREVERENSKLRSIHRKMEEEREQFPTKETFVTQAYLDRQLQLMEEDARDQERETRDQATISSGLGGFYQGLVRGENVAMGASTDAAPAADARRTPPSSHGQSSRDIADRRGASAHHDHRDRRDHRDHRNTSGSHDRRSRSRSRPRSRSPLSREEGQRSGSRSGAGSRGGFPRPGHQETRSSRDPTNTPAEDDRRQELQNKLAAARERYIIRRDTRVYL
ncbi:hypothetical protein H696_05744 [Fonticula alba]|uniref:Nuclear speckle splicing regulatory protein 1 N-terminal domain-containing protein n=1 Tax=Fonticula alba TaxID=691883 RepID=A0A058Z2P8_FONAL|nr:hypothetical protein H696_05744 [Fonticula alba]KCV67802.1 hypothetical protein H696_05744 [Fonticula alba]|eukprot:XP_009497833.1 hypothetical protein H696_05744 [Fonticula alba]